MINLYHGGNELCSKYDKQIIEAQSSAEDRIFVPFL